MFAHKDIIFRHMEIVDLDFLRELHNDFSTVSQLTDPLMVNEIQQKEWFHSVSSSSSKMRLIVLHENRAVGCVRLDNYDPINRSVQIGGDIHRDHRRRGLGTQMIEGIIYYCFMIMNCHRLYLSTLETNVIARKLYEKCGMREEGRSTHAIFRNGEYIDYINMYILFSDWKSCAMEGPII